MAHARLLRGTHSTVAFLCVWFVLFSGLALTFLYLATRHADITALAVCQPENLTPMVDPVLDASEAPYLCGTLIGNAKMDVSIRLYQGDRLIVSTPQYLQLGRFVVPVIQAQVLGPGEYTVKIVSGNQVVDEIEFAVAVKH